MLNTHLQQTKDMPSQIHGQRKFGLGFNVTPTVECTPSKNVLHKFKKNPVKKRSVLKASKVPNIREYHISLKPDTTVSIMQLILKDNAYFLSIFLCPLPYVCSSSFLTKGTCCIHKGQLITDESENKKKVPRAAVETTFEGPGLMSRTPQIPYTFEDIPTLVKEEPILAGESGGLFALFGLFTLPMVYAAWNGVHYELKMHGMVKDGVRVGAPCEVFRSNLRETILLGATNFLPDNSVQESSRSVEEDEKKS
ncbi:hypothetical protein L1987_00104 [Smallanthus sonchifolius]|uniref:Uncharacterized protein n=1 Tax=Smallanthus sonchifolius TaxID=185202 RepID=A0ACB9K1D8_9ASTR|nr:hypothetical protein L1987_00104 [Smallanthus sonchifolius]